MSTVTDVVAGGTRLLVSVPTGAAGTNASRRTGVVGACAGLTVAAAAAAASVPAVLLTLLPPATLPARRLTELLVLVAAPFGVKAGRGAWS